MMLTIGSLQIVITWKTQDRAERPAAANHPSPERQLEQARLKAQELLYGRGFSR